jgi:hypothetical protein
LPLLEIWNATKESVLRMNLEAVVRIAGDGHLRDGNETSTEFRKYLTEIESEKLAEYATYCIENAFNGSGQVLQDVVNEIGRRLGFTAENGRYQGVRNDIGFDGIWTNTSESLVVEVKTTDAYTIKLDVIAKYRDRLVEAGRVPKETPILLVIGRNDTESLEAQVRGSKHAWSMRIIGIDALIKLMDVNLSTLSTEVTEKIHKILRPFEYTRIDKIVDVVFTATEDKNQELDEDESRAEQDIEDVDSNTDAKKIIELKRIEGINRLSTHLKTSLIKRKRTFYSNNENDVHASISISKKYEKNKPGYWYGYHTRQSVYLNQAKTGYMVYGMLDNETYYAIPVLVLEQLKEKLDSTKQAKKETYWHIRFAVQKNGVVLKLNDGTDVDLSGFVI